MGRKMEINEEWRATSCLLYISCKHHVLAEPEQSREQEENLAGSTEPWFTKSVYLAVAGRAQHPGTAPCTRTAAYRHQPEHSRTEQEVRVAGDAGLNTSQHNALSTSDANHLSKKNVAGRSKKIIIHLYLALGGLYLD